MQLGFLRRWPAAFLDPEFYGGAMASLHPFRGDDSRTSSEQEFLEVLAAYIAEWAVPGMPAQSFEVVARMHPLVVMTQVPGVDVPAGRCTLQIGYWDDCRGCRVLEGEWGMSACWTATCTAVMG